MIIVLFRQKTAYDMRISDWSSDGWAADLAGTAAARSAGAGGGAARGLRGVAGLGVRGGLAGGCVAPTYGSVSSVAISEHRRRSSTRPKRCRRSRPWRSIRISVGVPCIAYARMVSEIGRAHV